MSIYYLKSLILNNKLVINSFAINCQFLLLIIVQFINNNKFIKIF